MTFTARNTPHPHAAFSTGLSPSLSYSLQDKSFNKSTLYHPRFTNLPCPTAPHSAYLLSFALGFSDCSLLGLPHLKSHYLLLSPSLIRFLLLVHGHSNDIVSLGLPSRTSTQIKPHCTLLHTHLSRKKNLTGQKDTS